MSTRISAVHCAFSKRVICGFTVDRRFWSRPSTRRAGSYRERESPESLLRSTWYGVVRCWSLALILLASSLPSEAVRAAILRWDTGEVIPGTEEIEPGPRLEMSGWNEESRNLRLADFSGGLDLREANLAVTWLDDARFTGAILTCITHPWMMRSLT